MCSNGGFILKVNLLFLNLVYLKIIKVTLDTPTLETGFVLKSHAPSLHVRNTTF